MNIFVTGASGFIGGYLCRALAEKGHRLIVLARAASKLDFLSSYPNVKIAKGDITDYSSLLSALPEKIDICFHCAACVLETSHDRLFRVNVDGTRNVCEACYQKKVPRLVHLSSVAVISGNPQVPLTEDLPYAATNEYGASKIEAEKIVLEYRTKGLKVAVFRPCMVYGKGEPHLMRLLVVLLKRRWLFLLGKAEQRWHLVYVSTVVDALMQALHNEGAYSGTFLVADAEALTVREVFSSIAQGLDVRQPWSLPVQFAPIVLRIPIIGRKLSYLTKDHEYSIDRLRQELHFTPAYSAKESLVSTARYYRWSPRG